MNLLAQATAPVNIGTKFGSPFGTTSTAGDLVQLIVRLGFIISGIFILFFIVFAGFSIIQGAGSNNPEAAKKGQQAASAAAIGFAVVFAAYWIVRLIEIVTGARLIL